MEIILYLLFAFLKFYFILGVIFTILLGVFAYSTRTENEYTALEVFSMIFIYPLIIYYLIYPERNDYEQ
jgi:hypothetical protein